MVHSKRPFGGAQHALRYLGQYTHRVAISNHRLVTLADGMITFRWRDSAHHNKKRLMALPVNEFLRRYLLHLLLPLCLQLLAQSSRFLELNLQQKPLAHDCRFGLVPNAAGPWS